MEEQISLFLALFLIQERKERFIWENINIAFGLLRSLTF